MKEKQLIQNWQHGRFFLNFQPTKGKDCRVLLIVGFRSTHFSHRLFSVVLAFSMLYLVRINHQFCCQLIQNVYNQKSSTAGLVLEFEMRRHLIQNRNQNHLLCAIDYVRVNHKIRHNRKKIKKWPLRMDAVFLALKSSLICH